MSTNPYATPKAAVADQKALILNADFVPGGRARPIAHGWTWITDAFELFKRQLAVWIGMGVVLIVILVGGAFVGVVAQLATTLLWPVFFGGVVIASKALDSGGEAELGHLFAGFRQHTGTLLAVGALYLVAYLGIVYLVSLATGVPALVLLGSSEGAEGIDPLLTIVGALIVLALLLPVLMAVWFAAPLVVFHEHNTLAAIRGSFVGCLKNILPFLWYGVVSFVLAIGATLPVLLGWLVLFPVFMVSLYTSYRDIYLKPRGEQHS